MSTPISAISTAATTQLTPGICIRSDDPGHLWRLYLQLVEIEQAFKQLKNDLSLRPIHHQSDARIEAHIFVAFLAYCLMVTLKQRLGRWRRG